MDKFYKCIVYVQKKDVEDDIDNGNNYIPQKSVIDLSEVIGWYETDFHKAMGLEQTIIVRLRNTDATNIVSDSETFLQAMRKYNSSILSYTNN